jgi:hypothetical protein
VNQTKETHVQLVAKLMRNRATKGRWTTSEIASHLGIDFEEAKAAIAWHEEHGNMRSSTGGWSWERVKP